MKKSIRIMTAIILSLAGIVIIGVLILWIYSPGKLPVLKDIEGNNIPGAISEKIWMEINGIPQGMFIRSENLHNPVLLYLHGGPGTPLLPFISYLEKRERLEKHFTVCYWDQRGAGMTYSSSTDLGTITLEQMVDDTHKVTEYLKSRFGQEKIYLLGHSWGSYLGVKTIQKYPDNYAAYFGVGQLSHQLESERLAYNYMLKHAREIGDKKAVSDLLKYDPFSEGFPQKDYNLQVRTLLMNKYGVGMLHDGVTIGKMAKGLLSFKGYTLAEKVKYVRGMNMSLDQLFLPLMPDNLSESSPKFEVPFYVFQGIYDYQVSYSLAKEYFNRVEAPKKEFFTFHNSAHSPNMEEPERFIKIAGEIAAGINTRSW